MPVYPISLPASPTAREITWQQVAKVAVASSLFNGSQQVYAHPGQWWEVSFELPPLSETLAAQWRAAFLSLNGREGSFKFAPTDESPQVAVSGTIVVDAVSAEFIDLSGMTGTFTPGDWIQIEDGLYQVIVGDTAVAGEATIGVWPNPRAEITASTSTVEYAAPVGRFRLFESFSWDMNVAKTHGISIGAREVL